jgi:hypothetical protein
MLARVRFLSAGGTATTKQSQLVFAPDDLIHRDGDKSTAWVVARGLAEQRAIERGTSKQDGWTSIVSGLQPGDQLIDGDTMHLRAGAKVRVVGESDSPSAQPADADAKGGKSAAHRMP